MKPKIPLARWSRFRGLPIVHALVLVGSVVGVAFLLVQRGRTFSVSGVARGRIAQVTTPYAAPIQEVPVELYEAVRKGQVVAVLDDGALAGQAEAVSAEIERLRAEHAHERSLLEADYRNRRARWTADDGAFGEQVDRLTAGVQELKAVLGYDREFVKGLRATMDNARTLVENGLGPAADLQIATAEYEATVRKIEENERLLASLTEQQREAQQRRAAHQAQRPAPPSEAPALEHLRQAIAVQQGLLEEIRAQRKDYILRAPFDGTVVEVPAHATQAALQRPGEGVLRGPGEAATPGDPIVTIAQDRPTEIVAFARDAEAARLHLGLEVELATTGPKPQRARAAVLAIAPTVQRMPERLWPDARTPLWGRPFLVGIPSGMHLSPGDRVTITGRWPDRVARAPAGEGVAHTTAAAGGAE